MKKKFSVMLICLSLIGFIAATATADDMKTGHYVSGIEGIKCGSLPGPGTYYRMYNSFYQADTWNDKNGDEDPSLDINVSVFANVHRFVKVKENKATKGDAAIGFIMPLQYTDVEIGFPLYPPPPFGPPTIDDNMFAMADPYLEGILAWHGPQYDAAIGAGIFIPVGKYDKDDQSSPGKDMWTLMLNVSGTYFFDTEKTWSASILARYETHTEKSDIDVELGDEFHFEWGLGKTIAQYWDVGLVGYCQWQVTDDSGDGVDWDKNDHHKVYAIGPEVIVLLPIKGALALKTVFEFDAEDRQEGSVTTLTFTKVL